VIQESVGLGSTEEEEHTGSGGAGAADLCMYLNLKQEILGIGHEWAARRNSAEPPTCCNAPIWICRLLFILFGGVANLT